MCGWIEFFLYTYIHSNISWIKEYREVAFFKAFLKCSKNHSRKTNFANLTFTSRYKRSQPAIVMTTLKFEVCNYMELNDHYLFLLTSILAFMHFKYQHTILETKFFPSTAVFSLYSHCLHEGKKERKKLELISRFA